MYDIFFPNKVRFPSSYLKKGHFVIDFLPKIGAVFNQKDVEEKRAF